MCAILLIFITHGAVRCLLQRIFNSSPFQIPPTLVLLDEISIRLPVFVFPIPGASTSCTSTAFYHRKGVLGRVYGECESFSIC